MKKTVHITALIILASGLFFACRGGVNKNNDHDYDGKNENDDGTHMQQMQDDTTVSDTTGRYPIKSNDDERKQKE